MKFRNKTHVLATISVGISVATVVTTSAATWDGPNNGDYATATNWNPDVVPLSGDTDIASAGGITAIYSTAGNITSTGRLLIGSTGAKTGTLTMQGSAGTLSFAGSPFNNANYIGVDGSTGTVNVNAGTLALTGMANGAGHLHIGSNGSVSNGTLNIGGGTVNVGTRITMGVGYPGSDAINTVGNNANGNATLTISSGSLNIGSSTVGDTDKGALYMKSPTGGTGTATVNLDGGTVTLTRFIPGAGGTSKTVNFNGGSLIASASVVNFLPAATGFTANVKNGGAVIDTQAFNITVGASLVANGTGGLTKSGSGTLTLSGANTYTGATNINTGNLILSGVGSIANTATNTITIGNGGTLTMDRTDTWGPSGGATNVVIPIVISAGGTMTNSGGRFNTLGPLTLNGGTLTTTGGAVDNFPSWALRGTVSVGGTVASTISDGTGLRRAINLGANSVIGTTFDVADAAAGNAVDLTVSAVLQNGANSSNTPQASSLTKTGAGTMSLTAANTYSGATNIDGGTLALGASGSINNTSGVDLGGGIFDVSAKGPGGYTVNNLSGVGTVLGSLNVSTTLSIGNSAGIITFESLALGSASTFNYELTGGASAADLGIVSSLLTIDNSVSLNLVQLGTYTANDKFTLFSYGTGNLTGTFNGLPDGSEFTGAGGEWKINYFDTSAGLNGGTGTSFVTITAIPEPASAAICGFGLVALLRRRR